jgi:DNA-binding MurR/RpiR family transcriptional regulator
MDGVRVTSDGDGGVTGDSSTDVISELRTRIREHWEGFSPAARAVCRSLSERSGEQLLFVSALELGAETKTSNATVIRTVQALGYSGLAELKAKIAEPFAATNRPELRARRRVESTGGDLANVWDKVLAESAGRIEQLRRTFSQQDYQYAIQLLLDAQQVVTYGFGTSFVVAEHLSIKLGRLGLRTRCIRSGGFLLADELLGIQGGDVVVMFAPPRQTTEVEVLLARTRAVGATTISVTDDLEAGLTDEVTVALHSPTTPTGLTAEPLTSIVVADVLAQGVAAANVEKTVESSHRLTTLREQLGFS